MKLYSLATLAAGLPLLVSFTACGGAEKPPEAPKIADAEDDEPDDGMEMMQEFGGMNEEKVNSVIKKLMPSFERCLASGSESNELFGGTFKLLVKVNRSGEAVAALAEESTLGDWNVERCILDKAKDARWPKPVGGLIGLVHYGPMSVEPGGRPPVEWDDARTNSTLQSAHSELSSCGGRGRYRVTAYVDTRGRVLSAGVAHAEDEGDSTAECLAKATKDLKFPSPGSWPAKFTFAH